MVHFSFLFNWLWKSQKRFNSKRKKCWKDTFLSLYSIQTSYFPWSPLLPLTEICAVSRISKKEIGRCFKLILKALETSVDLITTGDFMSRFCSNLGLPKQVQMAATFIARKAVELDLVPGRSPISVAAAAIYMASQASAEKKTQKGEW